MSGSARVRGVASACFVAVALLIGLATPGLGVSLVVLGVLVVGVGVVGANVVRSSFRVRYVPRELLGRTAATSAVLNFGTMPLAGLVAGGLGTWVGVRQTILLMAAIHVLASVTVLNGPYRRGRDLPSAPMDLRSATAAQPSLAPGPAG